MPLKAIGAGLPRTGTTSLKGALEQLLDGPCYHMTEFFPRADVDGILWWQAMSGDLDALDRVVDGWTSAVDWPASILWRELAERHPDAKVVLSHRGSAGAWWESANATVWHSMGQPSEDIVERWNDKMRRRAGFGDDWADPGAAQRRYDSHYHEVVAAIEPDRLLTWQATQGWEPLCEHLGVPVPADQDFHHHNTTAEFRAEHDWDT